MLITIASGVLVSRDIHRTTIATCRNLVLRHGGNIFHLTQTPIPDVSPPVIRTSLSTNFKTTSLTQAVF
jgi:hypothetical protein